jgi:hypothetical protein
LIDILKMINRSCIYRSSKNMTIGENLNFVS